MCQEMFSEVAWPAYILDIGMAMLVCNVTDCMEDSPSWEAKSPSASQAIISFFMVKGPAAEDTDTP